MTQAYKCDLCGNCVLNADDAKSQRLVVRQTSTINMVEVDIGIIIKVFVPHVCDDCWALTMSKVKAWINANV